MKTETLTSKYMEDTFDLESFTITENHTFNVLIHDAKQLTDYEGNSLIVGQSNFDETVIVIYDNEIDEYRYHQDKNIWVQLISKFKKTRVLC